MRILVTGAAGYVGSHACLELLRAGHQVVGFDNLVNSSSAAVERVQKLAGRSMAFERLDLRDADGLRRLLGKGMDAVLHFAGLKAVGESVEKPSEYHDNNVNGSRKLLAAMREAGCRRLVFSSSCTVYGEPRKNPVDENQPHGEAASPYARTKQLIEAMCGDLARSEPGWHVALLRYFNPVGAHESGELGEAPRGVPNNLMPFVMQTAAGRRGRVRVFGRDYPTPDGTGVRDYIHVVDLALGHLAALERLDSFLGAEAVNLGSGRGHSVLEVLAAASRAVGREIPHEFAPRRPGDLAAIWADPSLAQARLGWRARRNLDQMCADHWRWQKQNSDGY
ncbi:MAG: UDP-glucose 4-epimerase GalE [Elusimicrobia bacterium]|nr:UDP-glucose 4-epimerase GalE [Elusimicrobiota bacterium]